jgi:hypothetical protein
LKNLYLQTMAAVRQLRGIREKTGRPGI